jgi:16S rRNA (cytosine1407-C5)-methyltransferase
MPENTLSPFHQSLNRFSSILTREEIQAILDLQQQPLPAGIRINPLKVNPRTAIDDWSGRYQWRIRPVDFNSLGWTIESAGISPGSTIEHRMGQYYLQDPASMVPVSLFNIDQPHPLILDMAASPGGKTTHLIDVTRDKGFVLANDASKSRISALRSVLTNWGGINFAITQFPGESFGAWFAETFDMILLDAPCSMENMRPTDNHPLRETTEDERTRLHDRQVELLTSGLTALKTGGQLVYATCSLAPEEDEAVLDTLLKTYPDAITIENVSHKFNFHAQGLSRFQNQTFEPGTQNALRLWPHRTGMSGFFCALITKQQPVTISPEQAPKRSFEKTNLVPANDKQITRIIDQLIDSFGFDLDEQLQEYQMDLFMRYDQIFLIPRMYLQKFVSLPFIYLGMPVGKWINDQLEPSHTFISRFGHLFQKGKIIIEDDLVDQWIAGRDIRNPDISSIPYGHYGLVVDQGGRNLGLGKLLPKRLRNLLPRRSI